MLTHLDSKDRPVMVNVADKILTQRTAHAAATVWLPQAVAALFKDGELPTKKGAVFQTAILAGIMATKKTSDLIPLCHTLPIENAKIEISASSSVAEGGAIITIDCYVQTFAKTGVEMEALTGASVAALTVYDMCKALSHGIVVKEIRLIEKTGGKSHYKVS